MREEVAKVERSGTGSYGECIFFGRGYVASVLACSTRCLQARWCLSSSSLAASLPGDYKRLCEPSGKRGMCPVGGQIG
jgi:hypothetical protein